VRLAPGTFEVFDMLKVLDVPEMFKMLDVLDVPEMLKMPEMLRAG
jgi:hypothetical protein